MKLDWRIEATGQWISISSPRRTYRISVGSDGMFYATSKNSDGVESIPVQADTLRDAKQICQMAEGE